MNLHIAILNSQEIIERALNWKLDFGLVEGDASVLPQELHVEVFGHDQLVLVVAPGHRWSDLQAVEPEAIREGERLSSKWS